MAMTRIFSVLICAFTLSGCFLLGDGGDVPEARYFKTTRPPRAKVAKAKRKAAPRGRKPIGVGEGKWREIRTDDPELTEEQQNQIEEQLTAFPPGFPVSTFAVTITESDMRSVILDDVPIADHPEVDPNDWTGTGTD